MTTTKKKAKSLTLAQRVKALEDAEDGFTVLATQVNEVISAVQGLDMRMTGTRERLAALEQEKRPSERPSELCGVCGGSGQHPGTYTCVVCLGNGLVKRIGSLKLAGSWVSERFGLFRFSRTTGVAVCGVGKWACMVEGESVGSPWWRVWTVNVDGRNDNVWRKTPYATEADARAACDAELVRLGWTLEETFVHTVSGGGDPVVVAQGKRESLDAVHEEARLRDAVVELAMEWVRLPSKTEALVSACLALHAHRAKKGGA